MKYLNSIGGNLMSCQTNCDSCQDCDTCQDYCQSRQCSENGFKFSACVEKDEIIGPGYFDYSVWDKGIEQINEVFSRGRRGNPSKISKFEKTNRPQFLTADEFIRVCNGMKQNGESLYSSLNAHINGNKIKKDEVIYSKYFKDLETAIAKLEYHRHQCESCNANTCNTCDGCEGNNSCCEDDE